MRIMPLFVVAAAIALEFSTGARAAARAAALPAEAPNFEEHILPILRENCGQCHRADKTSAGLDVTSLTALEKGGDSGPAVVAGVPENSPLYRAMAHIGSESPMPPDSPKIAAARLQLVGAWIEGGLKLTGADAGKAGKRLVDIAVDAAAFGRGPERPIEVTRPLPAPRLPQSGRALPVMAMAANPWAPLVAVSGLREAVLHDAASGSRIGAIAYPDGELRVLRFSRSGEVLLMAGGKPTAFGNGVLVDVRTGNTIANVGDDFDVVLAADISPDQSLVALAGPEKLVRIYRVADGKLASTIKKHSDFVTALQFAPDGNTIVSGDRAGGLFISTVADGSNSRLLDGVIGGVADLDWRRDGKSLAVATGEGSVLVFEPTQGLIASKWKAHEHGATAVAYSADGRIISGGHDAAARVWSADGKKICESAGLVGSAFRVAFSHDGKHAFAGDWSGTVREFAADTGARLFDLSQIVR
jgi:hypothetical protein